VSLELRNIVVRFDTTTVLRGVNLHVASGETVALLGASGSGKSTLLRVVAGLHVPTEGRVFIDDVDITTRPAHLRRVGLIFQDQALFPHLDVARNIAFGLRFAHQAPRQEQAGRVAQLLELVGLRGFEGRRIHTLSGGEAQRVAIARALAPRPNVLLLDEPFSGLDEQLRIRLSTDLQAILAHEQTTAIHVTHDGEEASVVADRVVQLSDLQTSIS
jgi:thiamine transport system ATP-binding protein